MNGKTAIDITGPNQTRTEHWDDAVLPLASALEAVLGTGAHDLPAIVAGLNAGGTLSPHGTAWTPETLAAHLAELDR